MQSIKIESNNDYFMSPVNHENQFDFYHPQQIIIPSKLKYQKNDFEENRKPDLPKNL